MKNLFRFPMWGPRRRWRLDPKTRSEMVISEAASQTCYSAVEIIRVSTDHDVRMQLKVLEHVLFEEWAKYRKNSKDWPQNKNDAEFIWVWELLNLCKLVYWVQMKSEASVELSD